MYVPRNVFHLSPDRLRRHLLDIVAGEEAVVAPLDTVKPALLGEGVLLVDNCDDVVPLEGQGVLVGALEIRQRLGVDVLAGTSFDTVLIDEISD